MGTQSTTRRAQNAEHNTQHDEGPAHHVVCRAFVVPDLFVVRNLVRLPACLARRGAVRQMIPGRSVEPSAMSRAFGCIVRGPTVPLVWMSTCSRRSSAVMVSSVAIRST